jgi:taurine dioxygenase
MAIRIRQASYAVGAEISGVDLRERLDERTFAVIRQAFFDRLVLVFRGQSLSAEQQVQFLSNFGEVDRNLHAGSRFVHPERREIMWIRNPNSATGNPEDPYQGEHWHSDRSFTCYPTAISMLHAVQLPEVGGDTVFANGYRAYETLSPAMQQLVSGLDAVHVAGDSPQRKASGKVTPPVAQPVVRIHPVTGRKAIYLAEFPKVVKFAGMTLEESRPLLDFLCHHATRDQNCYRHRWEPNDLIVWDNRCLIHAALGDYDRTQIRDLARSTVPGEASGYVYEGPVEFEGPHF